jgi:hypothetical protein
MALDEPRYRFHRAMVSGAPEGGGLYALWRDAEVIFIGRAACIKDALFEKLRQASESATHYSWQLALRPADEEMALRYIRLPETRWFHSE